MSMKAAIFQKPHEPLVIEDVDIVDPGPGEVMVRTCASGVCHSDLHFVEGAWQMPMACVLGHEAAGVVDDSADFAHVRDVMRAVRQTSGVDVVPPMSETQSTIGARNPYKGLRAFQSTDQDDFFGRDELVQRMLDAVGAEHHPDDDDLGIFGSGHGGS